MKSMNSKKGPKGIEVSAALLLLSASSVAALPPLAVITPCPQAPSSLSVEPITVTAQYQPVWTCNPTTNCASGTCTIGLPMKTWDYLSTVIPCAWDGTTASTCTVTQTDAPVVVSTMTTTIIQSSPIGSMVTVLPGTNQTVTRTAYQTMTQYIQKGYSQSFNKLGPLAVPGFKGSSRCGARCDVQADGSRLQVVDVNDCRNGQCKQYEETWVSQPAPMTTAAVSAVCSGHKEVTAPTGGVFTFTFQNWAPATTMASPERTVTVYVHGRPTHSRVPPSVVTVQRQPWFYYVTQSCTGPTIIDFTITQTTTVTYTLPVVTSNSAGPSATTTSGGINIGPALPNGGTSTSATSTPAGVGPGSITGLPSSTLTSIATNSGAPQVTSTMTPPTGTGPTDQDCRLIGLILNPVLRACVAPSTTSAGTAPTPPSQNSCSLINLVFDPVLNACVLPTGTTSAGGPSPTPPNAAQCAIIGLVLDPNLNICVLPVPTPPTDQQCRLLGLVLNPTLQICVLPTTTSSGTNPTQSPNICQALGLTLNPILNICVLPTTPTVTNCQALGLVLDTVLGVCILPNGPTPPTSQSCSILGLTFDPLLGICILPTTSPITPPANSQQCSLLSLVFDPLLNACVAPPPGPGSPTQNCQVGLTLSPLANVCVLVSPVTSPSTTSPGSTQPTAGTDPLRCGLINLVYNPLLQACVLPAPGATPPTAQTCQLVGLALNPILIACVVPGASPPTGTTSAGGTQPTPGSTPPNCGLIGLRFDPVAQACVLLVPGATPPTAQTCQLIGLFLDPLASACVITNPGTATTSAGGAQPTPQGANGPTTASCGAINLILNQALNACVLPNPNATPPTAQTCQLVGLVLDPVALACVLPTGPTTTTTAGTPQPTPRQPVTALSCALLGLGFNVLKGICV